MGGEKLVGHCHSVMDEYETILIFKFSGGEGEGLSLGERRENSKAPETPSVLP